MRGGQIPLSRSAAEYSAIFGLELDDKDLGDAERTMATVAAEIIALHSAGVPKVFDAQDTEREEANARAGLDELLERLGVSSPKILVSEANEQTIVMLHLIASGLLRSSVPACRAAQVWVISARNLTRRKADGSVRAIGYWAIRCESAFPALGAHSWPVVLNEACARILQNGCAGRPTGSDIVDYTLGGYWGESADGLFTDALLSYCSEVGLRHPDAGSGPQPDGDSQLPRQVRSMTHQILFGLLHPHDPDTAVLGQEFPDVPEGLKGLRWRELIARADFGSAPATSTRLTKFGAIPAPESTVAGADDIRALWDLVHGFTLGQFAQLHDPLEQALTDGLVSSSALSPDGRPPGAHPPNRATLDRLALYDVLLEVRRGGVDALDRLGMSQGQATVVAECLAIEFDGLPALLGVIRNAPSMKLMTFALRTASYLPSVGSLDVSLDEDTEDTPGDRVADTGGPGWTEPTIDLWDIVSAACDPDGRPWNTAANGPPDDPGRNQLIGMVWGVIETKVRARDGVKEVSHTVHEGALGIDGLRPWAKRAAAAADLTRWQAAIKSVGRSVVDSGDLPADLVIAPTLITEADWDRGVSDEEKEHHQMMRRRRAATVAFLAHFKPVYHLLQEVNRLGLLDG